LRQTLCETGSFSFQGLGGIGVWVPDGVNDPPQRWQALRAWRCTRQDAQR
jgi:hypothetical protein